MTSRTAEKGKAAVATVKKAAGDKSVEIEYLQVELGSLKTVQDACEQLKGKKIDYLLLNAGITEQGKTEIQRTVDGIESTVAVNHVGGCLIATKLIPIMEDTASKFPLEKVSPMITFVSSDLHNTHSETGAAKVLKPIVQDDLVRFLSTQGVAGVDGTAALNLPQDDKNHLSFSAVWFYKYSKLLNILSAAALDKELVSKRSKVRCNSMEPGFIPASDLSRGAKELIGNTGTKFLLWCIYKGPMNFFARRMLGQPVRTLEEGAASEVFALLEGSPGAYYRLNKEDARSPLANEAAVVDSFWDNTLELLKEKGFD